jgi:hypothetical protein
VTQKLSFGVAAIRLENFMAFKDTGWIELRPISLLFGRNSSGKSAIIRALLLLRQSYLYAASNESFVFRTTNGFDFGDFSTVQHKLDAASSNNKNANSTINFHFRCAFEAHWAFEFGRYLKKAISFRNDNFNEHLAVSEDNQNVFEITLNFHVDGAYLSRVAINCPWISAASGKQPAVFVAEPGGGYFFNELAEEWWFGSDVLFEHELEDKAQLWSKLKIGAVSGFLPILQVGDVPFYQIDASENDVAFISNLFAAFRTQIGDFLESIIYLGPIRPEPRRIFALDEIECMRWEQAGWGDFLRYLREEADRSQFDEVDAWLQRLKLGERIDTERPRNPIGKAVSSRIKIRELQSVQSGFNLKDVGFGASQVLPIIIASVLAREGTLVIIEQPELHLHPSAQSALADLFIGTNNKIELKKNLQKERETGDIRFLLETHSEHLLLRFRRRLAESSAGMHEYSKDPNLCINSNDIGVYFVGRPTTKSFVEEIVLGEFGEFMNIPMGFEDFFSDDSAETSKMIRARLNAGLSWKGVQK